MNTTTNRAVPLGSPAALTPGRLAQCKRARGERCATPGCKAKPKRQSNFCGPCGKRLARVRADFEAEGGWNHSEDDREQAIREAAKRRARA